MAIKYIVWSYLTILRNVNEDSGKMPSLPILLKAFIGHVNLSILIRELSE